MKNDDQTENNGSEKIEFVNKDLPLITCIFWLGQNWDKTNKNTDEHKSVRHMKNCLKQ